MAKRWWRWSRPRNGKPAESDSVREVRDEIDTYLAHRARELMEAGHSRPEAERIAREAFGDAARVEAECVEIAGSGPRRRIWSSGIASLLQDTRFAVRGLRRDPGFAVIAVLVLALGIGANAAIFGLVEAALLRVPLVREPERLAAVYTTSRRGALRASSSYPDYIDYRDRSMRFSDIAAYQPFALTMASETGARIVSAELVTANYFTLLGVAPAEGRVLFAADDSTGNDASVVVLSHAFWRSAFAGAPGVIGRTVRLNEAPYTIVGVAAEGYSGLRLGQVPDMWVPLRGASTLFPVTMPPEFVSHRGARWLSGLVARLERDATIEQARVEMLAISDQLFAEDSSARGPRRVTVDPLPRYVVPGDGAAVSRFLAVLEGVVAITMLLACANLANLLLARGSARRTEMGVRRALGAGGPRLFRQLLTESLTLSLVGGVAGIAVAMLGLRLLAGVPLPFGFDVASINASMNARVLTFAALLCVATGLGFGLLPALHASRDDIATILREARGTARQTMRLRSALVAVQVALCVVLLVGAGLFLRTLQNRLRLDLGFPARGLALVTLDPSMNHYTAERNSLMAGRLAEEASRLPGVRSASVGMRVPVRPAGFGTFVEIDGYVPAPDEELRVEFNVVAPRYFETLGLPFVRGRDFTEADGPRPVAIIDETMAKRWWPNRDALGGVAMMGGVRYEVIGIVRAAAWRSLESGQAPVLFLPLVRESRHALSSLILLVRPQNGNAEALFPSLRNIVSAADPGLAIRDIGTMEDDVRQTVAPQRLAGTLLMLFGGLALLLAAVGIYGVVGYTVAQRRREVGVRVALGARRSDVIGLVARGMALPIALGTIAGVGAALALGRTVEGFVYGVKPTDPLTLGVTILLLSLAALVATLVPAHRAALLQPMEVMRSE